MNIVKQTIEQVNKQITNIYTEFLWLWNGLRKLKAIQKQLKQPEVQTAMLEIESLAKQTKATDATTLLINANTLLKVCQEIAK